MDILLFRLSFWSLTLAVECTWGVPCLCPNTPSFSSSRIERHASYMLHMGFVVLVVCWHHKFRGRYTKGIRDYFGRWVCTFIFRALHLPHAVGLRLFDSKLLQCSNWASFSLSCLSRSCIRPLESCSVLLRSSCSIANNSRYNPSVSEHGLYSWGYKAIFLDVDLNAGHPRFILLAYIE